MVTSLDPILYQQSWLLRKLQYRNQDIERVRIAVIDDMLVQIASS